MPKRVNASHILIKTEDEARELLFDLKRGADFAEVAKKKSKCPSGKNGGKLGWFRRGEMVKEFDTVAFTLKVGDLSEPVKTQFGWHIIKINETD